MIPNCQPKRLLLQCADHSGLWPRIAGGCHPARDTTTAIERAGFEIKASDRLMFAAARFEPAIPYILGTAQGLVTGRRRFQVRVAPRACFGRCWA